MAMLRKWHSIALNEQDEKMYRWIKRHLEIRLIDIFRLGMIRILKKEGITCLEQLEQKELPLQSHSRIKIKFGSE